MPVSGSEPFCLKGKGGGATNIDDGLHFGMTLQLARLEHLRSRINDISSMGIVHIVFFAITGTLVCVFKKQISQAE